MKVYAEYHYSAALLTDMSDEKRTMLVQAEEDQNQMLGEDWQEGVYEIDDEYDEYFEEQDNNSDYPECLDDII